MNILVTGANGQLGTEIRKYVKAYGNGIPDHTVYDRNYYIFAGREELDVCDKDAVMEYISKNHINVVINCAAYTAVDKAEEDRVGASKLNVDAPSYLAEACKAVGAVLIHISTDYVFGGNSNKPYLPQDGKYPINFYGESKHSGEFEIYRSGCKYLIFRTSWLYSSQPNNFVSKMWNKIIHREPIKVVCDQIGSPTNAADLAEFLVNLCKEPKNLLKKGIYHYANKGVASWYDLTMAIQEFLNAIDGEHVIDVVSPCNSSEFATKAKRPFYSVLDTSLTEQAFGIEIPYWRDSLKLCVLQLYGKWNGNLIK